MSTRTKGLPLRRTVLLVDDEPAVTEGLVRALSHEPYVLRCAQSAMNALVLLSKHPIDVIVVDQMMPGMGGLELLERVRSRHPHVVRIMLTGHAGAQAAMRAIHDGWVYQFLQKPCKAADLAAVIHNGLLLRSFQLPDESPHVIMPPGDQEALLVEMAKKEAAPASESPNSH